MRADDATPQGCVHAVGMLLASDLNAIASGSGSTPNPGATYDDVTRKTAVNAAAAYGSIPPHPTSESRRRLSPDAVFQRRLSPPTYDRKEHVVYDG